MIRPISYLHPFKAGDLLTLLPGVKHLYETTGSKAVIYQRLGMPEYFNPENGGQCMGLEMFKMLRPLMESQEYIHEFKVWEGQEVDIDVTQSRDSRIIPLPNGSIHHWVWSIVPEMQCDLFVPWIEIHETSDYPDIHKKVIINRTSRYQNPYITYFFLKEYERSVMFAGTYAEYQSFVKEFNLNIPLLLCDNALHLASAIKASKFFIGNQSMCWHIADGMKTTRLLETSTTFPNTFPTGGRGYFFMAQKTLELQFKRLFDEGS